MSQAPDQRAATRLAIETALNEASWGAPNPGEACVLVFDTALWAPVGMLGRDLDQAERDRAVRFRFHDNRDAYVLSHAFWRIALGLCLHLDASRVPLTCTASGQPMLPGTGLSTSLSHSGRHAAIAVCAGATVGVDIERVPSRVALGDLRLMICTPQESAELERQPRPALERELLALWTRKEALLKAFGVSLTQDLATFSAAVGQLLTPPAAARDQASCRVRALDTGSSLVGALAAPDDVHTCHMHALRIR